MNMVHERARRDCVDNANGLSVCGVRVCVSFVRAEHNIKTRERTQKHTQPTNERAPTVRRGSMLYGNNECVCVRDAGALHCAHAGCFDLYRALHKILPSWIIFNSSTRARVRARAQPHSVFVSMRARLATFHRGLTHVREGSRAREHFII